MRYTYRDGKKWENIWMSLSTLNLIMQFSKLFSVALSFTRKLMKTMRNAQSSWRSWVTPGISYFLNTWFCLFNFKKLHFMTTESITLICSMKLYVLSSKVSENDLIFQSYSVPLNNVRLHRNNLLPIEFSDNSVFYYADKDTYWG